MSLGTGAPEAEPFTLRLILVEGLLGKELVYTEATLEEGTPGRRPNGVDANWIAVRRLKRTKRPSWETFELSRSRLMRPSASVHTAPSGSTEVSGEVWFLEADRETAEASLRAAVRDALIGYDALVRSTLYSEAAAFKDFGESRSIGEGRPAAPRNTQQRGDDGHGR